MLAGPDWNVDASLHRIFATPESGADCYRITVYCADAGFETNDFISPGQYRDHSGILENSGTMCFGAFD